MQGTGTVSAERSFCLSKECSCGLLSLPDLGAPALRLLRVDYATTALPYGYVFLPVIFFVSRTDF